MIGFLRLFLGLLVVLTVLYLAVSIWSRRARRRKLATRWDSKPQLTTDRDAFIARGMRAYERSFRKRLILLIYVVPLATIAVIVYVTNFM